MWAVGVHKAATIVFDKNVKFFFEVINQESVQMKKSKQYWVRKTHRYLGVSIGVQFIFWTVSGLYFSWTNIDEIHGDHFRNELPKPSTSALTPIAEIIGSQAIHSLELRFINDAPYYWVNGKSLYHAVTGEPKSEITAEEAQRIARELIKPEYELLDAEYITEVGKHHEYRGRPLPAWAVSFSGSENLIAYISAKDGAFQRVRHRDWRWFDFLWMTHVMDFENRDDFNNILLRIFSLFGLLTVLSGFTLFFVSSKKRRNRTIIVG